MKFVAYRNKDGEIKKLDSISLVGETLKMVVVADDLYSDLVIIPIQYISDEIQSIFYGNACSANECKIKLFEKSKIDDSIGFILEPIKNEHFISNCQYFLHEINISKQSFIESVSNSMQKYPKIFNSFN